jgi:hypothetical protein
VSVSRSVRTTDSFLRDLEYQLGEERGRNGEPSRSDFMAIELPRIEHAFATLFDSLPELFKGRSDYRQSIIPG